MTAKLADVTIENRRGVARGHAHPRGARRDADRGGDGGGRARGGGQSALLRAGRAEDIGRGDVQFGAGDRIAAIGYLPTAAARRRIEGRTLQEIARAEKKDPLDVLTDIVVADQGHTFRVSFAMSEEDVRVALRDRLVSFCTDSPAMAEDGILSKEKSHPRAWGSAPRILGTCVRELKLLPLEEAIRKMTSLPATRMHLSDRGILRPGMAADEVRLARRAFGGATPADALAAARAGRSTGSSEPGRPAPNARR